MLPGKLVLLFVTKLKFDCLARESLLEKREEKLLNAALGSTKKVWSVQKHTLMNSITQLFIIKRHKNLLYQQQVYADLQKFCQYQLT